MNASTHYSDPSLLLACPKCADHRTVGHVGRTEGGMVILTCGHLIEPHEYQAARRAYEGETASALHTHFRPALSS